MDVLRSITVFLRVAEHQSFSRAAQSLGLVPSAVSRQVNELESWLGLRLFNRTTRSLSLTDDGRLHLEKCMQIVAQVEELQSLRVDPVNLRGVVRLTAPMMLGRHVLPAVLARFSQAHPQVNVQLTLMNRMADLVAEGFDLAVRGGKLADTSMIARNVGSMSQKTVASPRYLAGRAAPKTPDDLSAHDCLIYTLSEAQGRWSFLVDGSPRSFRVSGTFTANDTLCLKALALAGQGVARLPALYVRSEIESGALIELLPDNEPPPIPVHILYPSRRLMNPTVRALIEFLTAELRRMPIDEVP